MTSALHLTTSDWPCQRLYKLDARKSVLGNIGLTGSIPYLKTMNQVNPDECANLPNNGMLKDLLAELTDNLPGATFFHANAYDMVMEVMTNYDKHGTVSIRIEKNYTFI